MAPEETNGSDGDSKGGLTGTSRALYDGWMTGWSFEASRHLYFLDGDPQGLSAEDRLTLLSWISTYRNLIDEWGAVDADEITKELDEMEEQVMKKVSGRRETFTVERFDSHFEEVKGAIRARAPYAYYTVLFASCASRLRFPREGDVRPKLIGSMHIFLSNMKGIIPPGSFDVVDDDLSGMKKAPGDVPGPTAARLDKALKQRIQVWSDLIFGTINVYDTLNMWGTVILLLSIVGAGLALFLLVGGIIFGVYEVIKTLPGFDAQALNSFSSGNLSSFLQNVVPAVASLGLSATFLTKKAWDSVNAFELWVAIQLARVQRLRRRSVYAMIS